MTRQIRPPDLRVTIRGILRRLALLERGHDDTPVAIAADLTLSGVPVTASDWTATHQALLFRGGVKITVRAVLTCSSGTSGQLRLRLASTADGGDPVAAGPGGATPVTVTLPVPDTWVYGVEDLLLTEAQVTAGAGSVTVQVLRVAQR